MENNFDKVDWGNELQSLVAQAKTPEERQAAFAFAKAINPYLENPEMLKTLLGKIMQSPSEIVGVVAKQRTFSSLDEVKSAVGDSVNVIPL
ncbi:hypothetical protein CGG88_12025 [Vibrio parahaemolyticus]|uniref:hypothetical protein n=1 Tax=Vibrio parahaemolyticus TaxID=670 RepID=UPI00111F2DF8|nr:hypothetical protein [Vibrio parahaemolyticus]TOQ81089.1 hypothetical protein CGG88_12025 [Vibrio parahaemolyticus]